MSRAWLLIGLVLTSLGAETIRIDLNGATTSVPDELRPGFFYNNTTNQANTIFDASGITCNLMRNGDIAWYVMSSSSYEDVMSHVRSLRSLHEHRARMTDRFVIEINGMPWWLSRSQDTTRIGSNWRYFNSVAPRDYAVWDSLMRDIAAEVRTWSFTPWYEFWNEPDLFYWNGTEAELIGLYRHTAEAIKSVHPEARVGGFAVNLWYKGIVTQMPTVYGWIPDSLIRRYAATSHLIDSCALSGIPLDFITWHQFAPYPRLADQAADCFRRQLDSARLYATDMFVTEYNVSGSLREQSPQPGLMVRFAERLAARDVRHSVAAYQDFSSDPTREFFGDYGMLTRGALCKAAFRALQELNEVARLGRLLTIDTTLDGRLTVLAGRQGATVRVLLGNSFLPPLSDGYDVLLWGDRRINTLDLYAAGYTSWAQIDSTIMGIFPPHGPPEAVAAFEAAHAAYVAAQQFYYHSRFVELHLVGFTDTARGMLYRVDSLHNNVKREYDSLLANGWSRSSAVSYLYSSQSLVGDSIVVTDTVLTLELAPNSVVLLDLENVVMTGVADQGSRSVLSRLPTIVRGVLSISPQPTADGLRPTIYDANGRKVLSIPRSASRIPQSIDVSRLSPGVYFVVSERPALRRRVVLVQ